MKYIVYGALMVLAGLGLNPEAVAQEYRPKLVDQWDGVTKVIKSKKEWKKLLPAFHYSITREKGTERAFTGPLNKVYDAGTYYCADCGLALYSSETKFDSGTGWPSFWDVYKQGHVAEAEDNSFFMNRTEVLCARCDAHLGHVFPDGPPPTGLRHCLNSASLLFVPAK